MAGAEVTDREGRPEGEPRVTRVAETESAAGVYEMFETFRRTRGNVPNLFRVAAHRPPIAETLWRHMNAVLGPGEVPVLLKEFVAIRVSHLNQCRY